MNLHIIIRANETGWNCCFLFSSSSSSFYSICKRNVLIRQKMKGRNEKERFNNVDEIHSKTRHSSTVLLRHARTPFNCFIHFHDACLNSGNKKNDDDHFSKSLLGTERQWRKNEGLTKDGGTSPTLRTRSGVSNQNQISLEITQREPGGKVET